MKYKFNFVGGTSTDLVAKFYLLLVVNGHEEFLFQSCKFGIANKLMSSHGYETNCEYAKVFIMEPQPGRKVTQSLYIRLSSIPDYQKIKIVFDDRMWMFEGCGDILKKNEIMDILSVDCPSRKYVEKARYDMAYLKRRVTIEKPVLAFKGRSLTFKKENNNELLGISDDGSEGPEFGSVWRGV
jgi:hypothetical protein